MTARTEAELYPPLKAFLEAQGYEVKAEIGPCDILAIRGEEEPVAVEMKLSFSLALVMQGVARQAMFDQVYLAVPASGPKGWKLRYRDITALCRRLGLGLLAVRFTSKGTTCRGASGPWPLSAPEKCEKTRAIAEGVFGSRRRPERGWLHRREAHHRLSPGCASPRRMARGKWRKQPGSGGKGHRRCPRGRDFPGGSLWLVHETLPWCL